MRDQWAEAFSERARSYWTEARTRQLTGGKGYPLLPGRAPALLRAIGLLKEDGTLPASKVRKYRQVNHMLLVLQPALTALCEELDEVRVLDAGCGRSALTMLLAWWFAEHQRHPASILGVDRSAEMVAECTRRAALAGLENVRFQACELADLALDAPPHMVVSLHACDTATDDALVLGVEAGARFLAVAPCCQGELARAWKDLEGGPFATIHGIPHFRRTTAATLTDVFRVQLLRAAGYDTDAMEFVAGEHTPKNTLIRARRTGQPDPTALEAYGRLVASSGGAGIALAGRLGHIEHGVVEHGVGSTDLDETRRS